MINNRFRKMISVTLAFVLTGALLVTGCGSTQTSQPNQPKSKVAIEFWKFGGLESENTMFTKLVEEYNKSQDEVQVNMTFQNWGTRSEKIITSFNGGVAPDMMSVDNRIDEYGLRLGIISPIEDAFPALTAKVKKALFPEAINFDSINGKLWTIPTNNDMYGFMAYNTKLMIKAGLDPNHPPKTWSEFEAAALKMSKDGVSGYTPTLSLKNNFTDPANEFTYWLYPNGGRVLSDDLTKITFNDEAGVKTVEFMKKLYGEMALPSAPDMTYMDRFEFFFGGKIATSMGPTYLPGLKKDFKVGPEFEYTLADWPVPDPGTVVFPNKVISRIMSDNTDLALVSTSKKKEAVGKFLNWMVDNNIFHKWVTEIGARMPNDIASYTDPKLKAETQKVFPDLLKAYEAGTLTKGAVARPTYAGIGELEKILSTAIVETVTGKKPIKATLDAAAAQAQKMLDDYTKAKK
ncbi:MAG: extracellular solute-binding protein [Desulfitobacteriaceae bacterium]